MREGYRKPTANGVPGKSRCEYMRPWEGSTSGYAANAGEWGRERERGRNIGEGRGRQRGGREGGRREGRWTSTRGRRAERARNSSPRSPHRPSDLWRRSRGCNHVGSRGAVSPEGARGHDVTRDGTEASRRILIVIMWGVTSHDPGMFMRPDSRRPWLHCRGKAESKHPSQSSRGTSLLRVSLF